MRATRDALRPLIVLALLVALAAPARATNGEDDLPSPDVPSEPGPFEVGRTTFDVVDPSRNDRTLEVDVWYPVEPEDTVGVPVSVYDLLFAGLPSPLAFDEPRVAPEGPFPLVVFSHGNNGIRFQSFFLMEILASHGFVVAAPDHSGNTAIDIISPGTPFETRDRPLDVSLVITRMLEKAGDPGDPFYASVDGLRIAVMGHSFGGFTTMAVASGYQDVPPDPRVGVLVPISPAVGGLSDEELARIDLPELVLGGTSDVTVPIEPSHVRAFELPESEPKYRVDVIDAGHNSFTNICDFFTVLLDAGVPENILTFLLGSAEEGCGPDLIPIEEAHRVTNLYVVAFLRRQLDPDPRYQSYLTPEFASTQPVAFFSIRACGLGFELVFVLPPLARWRRRRRPGAAA